MCKIGFSCSNLILSLFSKPCRDKSPLENHNQQRDASTVSVGKLKASPCIWTTSVFWTSFISLVRRAPVFLLWLLHICPCGGHLHPLRSQTLTSRELCLCWGAEHPCLAGPFCVAFAQWGCFSCSDFGRRITAGLHSWRPPLSSCVLIPPLWPFLSPCQQQHPWVVAQTKSSPPLLPAHSLAGCVRQGCPGSRMLCVTCAWVWQTWVRVRAVCAQMVHVASLRLILRKTRLQGGPMAGNLDFRKVPTISWEEWLPAPTLLTPTEWFMPNICFPSGSFKSWLTLGRGCRCDKPPIKMLGIEFLTSRTTFHTCCHNSSLEELTASCVMPLGENVEACAWFLLDSAPAFSLCCCCFFLISFFSFTR